MILKTLITLLALSSAVADQDNRLFTSDVYNKLLVDNTENFLVSPFSVETVLALAQSGAKDKTAEEIRTTLHLPNTKEEAEAVIKSTLELFDNDHYVLQVADKIYVEEKFPILQEFKTVAKEVYQAQFENIKFEDAVSAANQINQWVSDQTNDKIRDLVSPDDFSKETKVLLLNALYFLGNWSTPFDPANTKKSKFYKSSENEVETEMMFIKALVCNYSESEALDAQILEVPLEGDATMTFILPNQKEGLGLLEKTVNSVFDSVDYSSASVQITLPKFKIESSINFKEILKNLGVEAAFDPAEADFTGIAGQKGDLIIGEVMQKTFINVNELGVEAAAATGVINIIGPSPPPPPATKFFVADHPFIFYLKVNEVILFEGRVLTP